MGIGLSKKYTLLEPAESGFASSSVVAVAKSVISS